MPTETSQATPRKEYYTWKIVDFCCLCASDKSDNRFTKIFSTNGKRKKLAEHIISITSLDVKESDSNAQFLKVCRSCKGKLVKASEFKNCIVATLSTINEKNFQTLSKFFAG